MRRAILLVPLFFVQFSFSQSVCEEGGRIKSGHFILSNGDKLNFEDLECQQDKVKYFNKVSNETEFLYKDSVKEIIVEEEATDKLLGESTEKLLEESVEPVKEVRYKTFKYKDQEVKVQLPSKERAVVYFVRTSSAGSIINFRYYDKDKFIGKFSARGYIRYECDPGEHIFLVASENKEFIKAELEAGKIYMVEVVPTMGITRAQVSLNVEHSLGDKKYEKMKKRVLKILTKEDWNKTPTKAELKKEISHEEEIKTGLKRYEKKLKKGKVKLIKPDQDFK